MFIDVLKKISLMLVIAAVGPVKSNLFSSGGLNIFPKRQSSSRPDLPVVFTADTSSEMRSSDMFAQGCI